MLSIQKVNKHYHSKKGESVHVLKDISIDFPKKGFVCLIGKSGSGKSTLLNVLGGLDRYDSGEILIKGKSSHSFKAKEWDSYRNTYLGFVFQDFNIIDSYSIGANIALALQLQGVKSAEAITRTKEILKSVEAENLFDRKPNELSGGQKQRIAIARALVKNPEIIIADEPTGNLDSETSLVIMKILQNLAKDHLVIMVTHDMDFANEYGDRLIELKDGSVIKDQTVEFKSSGGTEAPFKGGNKQDVVFRLPKGTLLTQETIEALNEMIRSKPDDHIYITASPSPTLAASVDPKIANIKDGGSSKAAVSLEYNYAHDFKLIRSKLPYRNSIKMALNAIWSKKFKLLFASILFVIAIGLFGFSRTVTRFDFPMAASLSYQESSTDTVFISKQETVMQPWGEEENIGSLFTMSEVLSLSSQTGLNFGNIYDFSNPISLVENASNTLVSAKSIKGLLEVDSLAAMNLQLTTGRFPQNTNEVAITDYAAAVLSTLSAIDYLATNPTLSMPFKTVNIVGVIATDYQDYTYLNNLNPSQLLGEQAAVLAFRNNDQILYSRAVVPKGFYAEYEKSIDMITSYYILNVYLESRELENDWPYEYIGDSFIKITPELLNSPYVELFPGITSVPDNGIILNLNTYSRLLFSLGRVSNESTLSYLNDWGVSLTSKMQRLQSAGLGSLTLETAFSNQVNNAWLPLEGSVVVGLIDFEQYKNNELLPPLWIEALEDANISVVSETNFSRYGRQGFVDYLDSLRRIHLPSFVTFEAYSAAGTGSIYEYADSLAQALQNADVTFIFDGFVYGYIVYLTDRLNQFNISYPTFTQYASTVAPDPYGYSESLGQLLLGQNRTYLDLNTFNQTYSQFGDLYYNYLEGLIRNNDVDFDSVYQEVYGATLISASRYDQINPYTAQKVHGLAIQLSDDVMQNYGFFTAANEIGVKHVTPSGELLQVFQEFTSEADAIFGYVSLGLAAFAALLLFLNISQSILAKKKEIGTLRAMGARGNDVALIFVNEASVLGLVSAVLAIVGITVATVQLNLFLSNQLGVDLSIFNISAIITLEMLLLTLVIVLLAAFLPVKRVSSMKPIDAIKNK